MVAWLPIVAAVATTFAGCYSFSGGTAPSHLRTVTIPQTEDNSGFGRASIRIDLTNVLVQRFRDDNSLRVIDDPEADSRLEVTIVAITNNQRLAVSATERETVRGVAIEARVTFYDALRERPVFERRAFQGASQYDIAEGSAGETRAMTEAIAKLADDILVATVDDW